MPQTKSVLIGTNGKKVNFVKKMIAGLELIDSGQLLVNSGAQITCLLLNNRI